MLSGVSARVAAGEPTGQVDETEGLKNLIRSMKRDPSGRCMLGRDGVLRTFDADRNVLDVRGLTPQQIQSLLDAASACDRCHEAFRGVDGSAVTDHKALYYPVKLDGTCVPQSPRTDEKTGGAWQINQPGSCFKWEQLGIEIEG